MLRILLANWKWDRYSRTRAFNKVASACKVKRCRLLIHPDIFSGPDTSPTNAAITGGNLDIVKLLGENGAKFTSSDVKVAIQKGADDIVRYLLSGVVNLTSLHLVQPYYNPYVFKPRPSPTVEAVLEAILWQAVVNQMRSKLPLSVRMVQVILDAMDAHSPPPLMSEAADPNAIQDEMDLVV